MNNEQFILFAIRKLAKAILTGKYDVYELEEIHKKAGDLLPEGEED